MKAACMAAATVALVTLLVAPLGRPFPLFGTRLWRFLAGVSGTCAPAFVSIIYFRIALRRISIGYSTVPGKVIISCVPMLAARAKGTLGFVGTPWAVGAAIVADSVGSWLPILGHQVEGH